VLAIVAAGVVVVIVAAVAAVTFLGRPASDPAAKAWSTPDGAVTVMMRGTPVRQTVPAQAGLTSTSMWLAKNRYSSFSVDDDVIDPATQVDASKVLAAVPAAVIAPVPSAVVTSSTSTTYQGFPALRFGYRAPAQNAVALGLAVITPTHLIVVLAGTTPSNSDKIDPYLSSLKINS
jgi:hypothetical protein